MQQCLKKIGILGGTFNPIHCGHLIIAESVRESFCLDKIMFIPSGQPPHKPDIEVLDAHHRYEMVKRAVASNRYFEASRMEIDREGYTYTINTLQQLRKEYGEEADLFFIIGADVIPELITWKNFRDVFGLCEFIAVQRPGNSTEAFGQALNDLKANYKIKINVTEAPLVDISSSEIRKKCLTGKSIKYLVPESVEEYIITEGLYKNL